jgi:hypothetical protein
MLLALVAAASFPPALPAAGTLRSQRGTSARKCSSGFAIVALQHTNWGLAP